MGADRGKGISCVRRRRIADPAANPAPMFGRETAGQPRPQAAEVSLSMGEVKSLARAREARSHASPGHLFFAALASGAGVQRCLAYRTAACIPSASVSRTASERGSRSRMRKQVAKLALPGIGYRSGSGSGRRAIGSSRGRVLELLLELLLGDRTSLEGFEHLKLSAWLIPGMDPWNKRQAALPTRVKR